MSSCLWETLIQLNCSKNLETRKSLPQLIKRSKSFSRSDRNAETKQDFSLVHLLWRKQDQNRWTKSSKKTRCIRAKTGGASKSRKTVGSAAWDSIWCCVSKFSMAKNWATCCSQKRIEKQNFEEDCERTFWLTPIDFFSRPFWRQESRLQYRLVQGEMLHVRFPRMSQSLFLLWLRLVGRSPRWLGSLSHELSLLLQFFQKHQRCLLGSLLKVESSRYPHVSE